MKDTSRNTQRIYLGLILLSTLASSFIWGINTLFLLDAGLSNVQAFAANAFFTLGMVLFEVPTGVVADIWGRKVSYVIGTLTLLVSTVLYHLMWKIHAPFWGWAVTSALLGLGFTFFSGATEAWLVDALNESGYEGGLEAVFARGQIVGGAAMLIGSVAGGYIAQVTNLGVPYIIRAALLAVTFFFAIIFMKDLGFTPKKDKAIGLQMRQILKASIDGGLKKAPVRWIMLMAPFTAGVSIYAFYAMQPYLLELYGQPTAYGIAGLAAAVMAGAQIAGGLLAPKIRKMFKRRTDTIILTSVLSVLMLGIIGATGNFWIAVAVLVLWALSFAAVTPIRQAYLNGLIPSSERATVLSFDSLMGSSGAVISQPALGRVADTSGYSMTYVISAAIQLLALPFALLARRENTPSDQIEK
jgi:MFS family permease